MGESEREKVNVLEQQRKPFSEFQFQCKSVAGRSAGGICKVPLSLARFSQDHMVPLLASAHFPTSPEATN